MRASSKKTPAAVLRSIIGIKVPEMAELLQCSTATIQSIESGRLKVTDMIAFKMYDQTGVSIQWLQGGDAKRPMTAEGKPYTRAAYERDYILKKLDDNHGNISRTAEVLGLERSHLYRKMKTLGIAVKE